MEGFTWKKVYQVAAFLHKQLDPGRKEHGAMQEHLNELPRALQRGLYYVKEAMQKKLKQLTELCTRCLAK